MIQLQRIAPKLRQHLNIKLHLAYLIVTKGHNLTGVTPVARPIKAHRHPTCSQIKNYAHRLPPAAFQELNHRDLVTQPNPTNHIPTNRVKGSSQPWS
jgi:lysophospholipase L1-like esterase